MSVSIINRLVSSSNTPRLNDWTSQRHQLKWFFQTLSVLFSEFFQTVRCKKLSRRLAPVFLCFSLTRMWIRFKPEWENNNFSINNSLMNSVTPVMRILWDEKKVGFSKILPPKKRDKYQDKTFCVPLFSKKKVNAIHFWKSGTNDKDAGLRDRSQKASSVPPKS